MSVKWNKAASHKWNIADTVTSLRLCASFVLLFLPLCSAGFLTVYTLTGLTDALDGTLARKAGTAGDFGARLDSIADLVFYGVVLIRFFPALQRTLPVAIWYAVSSILFVRLVAYAVAVIRYHRFASLHTWLNKLTGVMVFLLPYVLAISTASVYGWVVCAVAFAASIEELLIHLCSAECQTDRKSIFSKTNRICK